MLEFEELVKVEIASDAVSICLIDSFKNDTFGTELSSEESSRPRANLAPTSAPSVLPCLDDWVISVIISSEVLCCMPLRHHSSRVLFPV